jgi:hypothetical protein
VDAIVSKTGLSLQEFEQAKFCAKTDLFWNYVKIAKENESPSLEEKLAILSYIRHEHSREDCVPNFDEMFDKPSLVNLVSDALSL